MFFPRCSEVNWGGCVKKFYDRNFGKRSRTIGYEGDTNKENFTCVYIIIEHLTNFTSPAWTDYKFIVIIKMMAYKDRLHSSTLSKIALIQLTWEQHWYGHQVHQRHLSVLVKTMWWNSCKYTITHRSSPW